VGSFPEEEWRDYCWGGCPGALEEAVYLFRRVMPGYESGMKKVRYVVGRVEGPLDLAEDERVLFVGDCTSWQGEIDGEHVTISSRYTANRDLDPHGRQSVDPIRSMVRFARSKRKDARWYRLEGCPVSQSEQQQYLALLGEIDNVGENPELLKGATNVYLDYLKMRTRRLLNHMLG
jgi:hypothetical protein